jgi:hypothetical protein
LRQEQKLFQKMSNYPAQCRIEHYFSRTSVLTRLRHGLWGPYLDELATVLHQQGYARDSIRHYLRACDQFGRWLTHHGYTTQEVDEALVGVHTRFVQKLSLTYYTHN